MAEFKQLFQVEVSSITPVTIYSFGITTGLDVDTITYRNGNTLRITFNGTPDLSNVKKDMYSVVRSATNEDNNGEFLITAVDDTNDWIELINLTRADNAFDEATDSPALVDIKPAKQVVIKEIYPINLGVSGQGFGYLYHDDDGTTYNASTTIQLVGANAGIAGGTLKDMHIMSNDARMTLGYDLSVLNPATITLTGYGFYVN